MTFRGNNLNYNTMDLARRLGYIPLGSTQEGELNSVRHLGVDYPRFHVYLKEDPKILTFNVHLDQKRPSYRGTHAHGGDYDSDTVRGEVARIKGVLYNL